MDITRPMVEALRIVRNVTQTRPMRITGLSSNGASVTSTAKALLARGLITQPDARGYIDLTDAGREVLAEVDNTPAR